MDKSEIINTRGASWRKYTSGLQPSCPIDQVTIFNKISITPSWYSMHPYLWESHSWAKRWEIKDKFICFTFISFFARFFPPCHVSQLWVMSDEPAKKLRHIMIYSVYYNRMQHTCGFVNQIVQWYTKLHIKCQNYKILIALHILNHCLW